MGGDNDAMAGLTLRDILISDSLGLIHTGRGTRCVTQGKQMGPVVVNGSIHTARKQHQRKNVPVCMRIASHVLCELGLKRQT